MSNPQQTDERRQYFRIKNKLLMSFQRLDAENLSGSELTAANNTSDPKIQILHDLNIIEADNTSFCRSIEDDRSKIAQHLLEINKKLAYLAQTVIESMSNEFTDLIEVDISGGGLRFSAKEQIVIGQQLKVDIILLPCYYNISALATVVDNTIDPQTKLFDIAITFSQIKETDRDTIIGHVFKAQSKQLRDSKQNENQSSKD